MNKIQHSPVAASPDMVQLALCARSVSVIFGGLSAVCELDLDVRRDSIHAIIGPNGAGKTTAVNALSGFHPPTSGQIWINGKTQARWSAHRVAQAGLARTFQNIRLFGGLSVLESVLVGGHGNFSSGLLGILMRSAKAREEERRQVEQARALIEFVGLPADVVQKEARALSYGNQRRVEMARALMSSPGVLVLDEPLAGMNVSEKQDISELIRTIRGQGVAVLLIEHDMDVIRSLAQRVTVLARGRKLAEGAPTEVLSNEQVQAAYLGKMQ